MPGDQFAGIGRGQGDLPGVNLRAGIERGEGGLAAQHLRLAHLVGPVQDLALEIVETDRVGVGNRQMPDPCRSEVKRGRAAEPARAGDEDPRPLQLLLAGTANLLQHDVPGEAFDVDFAHGSTPIRSGFFPPRASSRVQVGS